MLDRAGASRLEIARNVTHGMYHTTNTHTHTRPRFCFHLDVKKRVLYHFFWVAKNILFFVVVFMMEHEPNTHISLLTPSRHRNLLFIYFCECCTIVPLYTITGGELFFNAGSIIPPGAILTPFPALCRRVVSSHPAPCWVVSSPSHVLQSLDSFYFLLF